MTWERKDEKARKCTPYLTIQWYSICRKSDTSHLWAQHLLLEYILPPVLSLGWKSWVSYWPEVIMFAVGITCPLNPEAGSFKTCSLFIKSYPWKLFIFSVTMEHVNLIYGIGTYFHLNVNDVGLIMMYHALIYYISDCQCCFHVITLWKRFFYDNVWCEQDTKIIYVQCNCV